MQSTTSFSHLQPFGHGDLVALTFGRLSAFSRRFRAGLAGSLDGELLGGRLLGRELVGCRSAGDSLAGATSCEAFDGCQIVFSFRFCSSKDSCVACTGGPLGELAVDALLPVDSVAVALFAMNE